MPTAQAIQFSPGQACRILGLAGEQLRAWLPASRARVEQGFEGARLTLSDLVGLLVLRELFDRFALNPKPFRVGIERLFAALNAVADVQALDGCIAVLEPDRGVVLTSACARAMGHCGARFAAPLSPLLASLRDYVFA